MATLVVLAVGWAAVGGLWLVRSLAEARECKSVDRYQASRSVLSTVTVRACPDAAAAATAPEAHVRVVEGDRAPVVLASRAPARRGRARRRTTHPDPRGPRPGTGPLRRPEAASPAGGCAAARSGGRAPDDREVAAPATIRISTAASGDRPVLRFDDVQPPVPVGSDVDTGQPASRARRRGRRLAGQVGAVAAVAAAVALLGPPAAAVLGRAGAIPTSGVEILPGDVPGVEVVTPVVGAARRVLTLGGDGPAVEAQRDADGAAAPAPEPPYLEPILTPDVWAPGRSWPSPADAATASPRS